MESDNSHRERETASPLEKALLKLLLVVFFCAIGGIILVVLSRIFSSSSGSQTLLNPLSDTTPAPSPMSGSFQEALSAACSAKAGEEGTYTLSLDALPVVMQSSALQVVTGVANGTMCKGTNSEKYVLLTTKSNQVLYLYDKHVGDLGTQESSLLTPPSHAQTIPLQNDISLTVFLKHNKNTTIGDEPVVVRGTKTLHLSDGETAFISTDVEAIPGDDPRLLTLLSSYAIPSSLHPGKKDIDPTREADLELAIKRAFFSNFNLLAMPEREKIMLLEVPLYGISAR